MSVSNSEQKEFRKVPFPNACVLHIVYSEWDEDLEVPSQSLGLIGVQVLGMLAWIETVIVSNFIEQLNWLTLVMLYAPALAIVTLIGVLPLTLNCSFAFRHVLACVTLLTLVLLTAASLLLAWGDYSIWMPPRRWTRRPPVNWQVVGTIATVCTLIIPMLAISPTLLAAAWTRRFRSQKYITATVIFLVLVISILAFRLGRTLLDSANQQLITESLACAISTFLGVITIAAIVQWHRGICLKPAGGKLTVRFESHLFWTVQCILLLILYPVISFGAGRHWTIAFVIWLVAVMTLTGALVLHTITANNFLARHVYPVAVLLVGWIGLASCLFQFALPHLATESKQVVVPLLFWALGALSGILCLTWLSLGAMSIQCRLISSTLHVISTILVASGFLFETSHLLGEQLTVSECLIAGCELAFLIIITWLIAALWLRCCGWSVANCTNAP